MNVDELLRRIASHVRAHDLIAPGAEVTCLVSGGADSTCLWHALGSLGFRARALHVHHGVRGAEADADADHCSRLMGAEVVHVAPAPSEAAMRDLRYAVATDRLRATGHTASDQVETVLYRIVSSGTTRGIRVRRDDGIVRPLLPLWREETEAYCRAVGLPHTVDSSNDATARGAIRRDILPLLRSLHPGADANLLALADRPPRLPRTLEHRLLELLSSRSGSKTADLGDGIRAVREYGTLRLEGTVRWGPWVLEPLVSGLSVRSRLPGDRLAGRRKKVQDILVDAKVPRSERDAWPIVVCEDEVVAVPGITAAPGWEAAVSARLEQ